MTDIHFPWKIHIEWSEEDGVWIARCEHYPSLAGHGPTALDALKEFEKVVRSVEEGKWEESKLRLRILLEAILQRSQSGHQECDVCTDTHRIALEASALIKEF